MTPYAHQHELLTATQAFWLPHAYSLPSKPPLPARIKAVHPWVFIGLFLVALFLNLVASGAVNNLRSTTTWTLFPTRVRVAMPTQPNYEASLQYAVELVEQRIAQGDKVYIASNEVDISDYKGTQMLYTADQTLIYGIPPKAVNTLHTAYPTALLAETEMTDFNPKQTAALIYAWHAMGWVIYLTTILFFTWATLQAIGGSAARRRKLIHGNAKVL